MRFRSLHLRLAAAVLAVALRAGVATAQSFTAVDAFEANGAFGLIIVPAGWNGSLFVYAHGYAADASAIQPYPADITPANLGTKLTGAEIVLAIPLHYGYAVATTTYRSAGWAVEDAYLDVDGLRRRFVRRYGPPVHTYVWGHSLGGLVAEGLVERHSRSYDGALALCAPGAGARRFFNRAWDVRAVYDEICGAVPGAALACGLCTDGATRCLDDGDCPADQRCDGMEPPAAENGLGRACLDFLIGPPGGSRPDQRYDAFVLARSTACFGGATPSAAQAARKDLFLRATGVPAGWLGSQLFFSSVAMAEVVHRRTGGRLPWANTRVTFPWLELSGPEAAALAAGIRRTVSDVSATRFLRRFYEPSAHTRARVLTLHAVDDGIVPVAHEEKYREAFHAAGRDAQLVQVYTAGGGHCLFSAAEHIAAVLGLTGWVEQGTTPTLPALQATCADVEPLTAGPCRLMDLDPPAWGERVPERAQAGVFPSSLACADHLGDCPADSTCGTFFRCE